MRRSQDVKLPPVILASGTLGFFGEGYGWHKLIRPFVWITKKSAMFVAKTVTVDEMVGNMPLKTDSSPKQWKPDCIFIDLIRWIRGGMLNAVWLSNFGLQHYLTQGKWQECTKPFALSVMLVGETHKERLLEARKIVNLLLKHWDTFKVKPIIKLNRSCPNVKHGNSASVAEQLTYLMKYSARQFGYMLAMPNTKKSLTNMLRAGAYYDAIKRIKREQKLSQLRPFIALYLTDDTTVEDIRDAKESGIVLAVKSYPKGATTNSSSGVTDIKKRWPIFAYMEEHKVPLSVHSEVTDPRVGLYDRERVFVDTILTDIHKAFPLLRIIVEHVSTREGVQFVQSAPDNVVATITPHHMLCNCNDVYMCPSRNCYPVINSPADQDTIIAFAISEDRSCFLGTDSAPHPDGAKFCDGGSGGCFTDPRAIELYAEAFERAGALDHRFEKFASIDGPNFYRLPESTETIQLVRKSQVIAGSLPIGKYVHCTPFMAGETLQWSLV